MTQPKPGHFHVVHEADIPDIMCDRCGTMVRRVEHMIQNAPLALYWNVCIDCAVQIEFADSTRTPEEGNENGH